MSKRTVFSTISPLPSGVSREVVLDFLHNHTEMIDLNPLVIERHFINPPTNVDPNERHCVWYSMTDKIDYLPGGKVSGDVSYTCAFHDLSNGIQTHCRAPLGVDIRDKWTLHGSLPGEPSEPTEIGIGAPASGLYIREDVDLRCNILMTRFVKKNLMKSHAALVDKLVGKAREISAQRTSDAFDNGRLSPPSIAQAMSRPWSPPMHGPVQSYQRLNSSGAHSPSSDCIQEARNSAVQAYRPTRNPYSEATLCPVPSSYGAPLQPSSQAQNYSASPPGSQVPSQHHFPSQPNHEYPPATRPPQQHPSERISPPYPLDDEDAIPAPLRVGIQDQDANAASIYSTSSRSRSSSDFEHPMYPHLSPYSSVFSERSSSPDEPRTPESARPGEPKEYLGTMDHPDVLKPGSWRPSARLSGPYMADFEWDA